MLLLTCAVAQADSVPLTPDHGTFAVPVLINDKITLDFMIDSGASDVTIPADVFLTLTRTGTVSPNDVLDKQAYELADGSKQTSQRFRIRSLRVGGLELRNVVALVIPPTGSLLLGQSFLSRLDSWSIDNQRQMFIINESSSSGGEMRAPPMNAVVPGRSTQTSDWKFLDKNEKETELLIDLSSIKPHGNSRTADLKYVFVPETIIDKGNVLPQRWLIHFAERDTFDCSELTYMNHWQYITFANEAGVRHSNRIVSIFSRSLAGPSGSRTARGNQGGSSSAGA